MSITCSFLLFLLCLSLHLCSARRLGALDNKNKLEKKLHFSIKNDMKNGFRKNKSFVGQVIPKSSKVLRSIKEESIEESHADDDTDQKLEDAETNHKTEENDKEITSGAVQRNNSVFSVPWRVPHRKLGEKYPVFNLDYSAPRTHPPPHN